MIRLANKQRKIIHVDMDSFYASIEIRDNPTLQHKPVAVGGSAATRGVLCTCNYIARTYGLHAAMSTAKAFHLCPKLILLPVNMNKYHIASQAIHEIFRQYTSHVEPIALDEAFLDVTDCPNLQGSATWIAQEIREKIFSSQHITASAGVAPNKFLAKVASDWNKPNGLFVITPHEIKSFIPHLPVKKIPGVGHVTAKKLTQLNIITCKDLQKLSQLSLIQQFGKLGRRLYDFSRGIDHRPVNSHRIRKSLSVEETFATDLPNLINCLDHLPALIDKLHHRLARHNEKLIAKQFIKLKFHDFSHTSVETVSTEISHDIWFQLLKTGFSRHNKPVRLIGVGIRFAIQSKLPEQLCFDI